MNIKKYITTHGTSYYLASLFFPKNIKQEVFLLYAFVRVADDIVDNEHEGQKEKLQAFIARTQNIFSSSPDENTTERDQIIIPFAKLCKDKQIKQEWIESFLSAMKSDCEWKEYKTYTQLQEYMVGSAEVVGLMMCQIIGYPPHDQEKTFYHARKLGEAMQYTNFLRDIKEDRVERQRIYIPQDRLTPFGLDQNDIKKYCE
jgi:phytoene synthase